MHNILILAAFLLYIVCVIIVPIYFFAYYLMTTDNDDTTISYANNKHTDYKKYYENQPVELYEKITDSLMKMFENESENIKTIDPAHSFIVRLNLMNLELSNYLEFKNDYDMALFSTMEYLLAKFNPSYASVGSAEIILMFNANTYVLDVDIANMKADIINHASMYLFQAIDYNDIIPTNNYCLPLTKCTKPVKLITFTAKVIVFPKSYEKAYYEYTIWRNVLQTKSAISNLHTKYFGQTTDIATNDKIKQLMENENFLKTDDAKNTIFNSKTRDFKFNERFIVYSGIHLINVEYEPCDKLYSSFEYENNIIKKLLTDFSLYSKNFGLTSNFN